MLMFLKTLNITVKIMGMGWFPEDDSKLTTPEIFSYPALPHLATKIDGREIDLQKSACYQQLAEKYEVVLLEGAGGLMVPLTTDLLSIDYIAAKKLPVILVSSGRLGSINHTILSLEALKSRGLELHALAYNLNDESQDELISKDTASYLKLIWRHIFRKHCGSIFPCRSNLFTFITYM